jgi:hypothetical protein
VHKITSPVDIFTVELTALIVAFRHIGEVIQPPEKCLILTDSLSSNLSAGAPCTNVSRYVATYCGMELRLNL